MKTIKIGKYIIGSNYPVYFIADIGANHDGDLNRAFKLIELAKESGATAAKFQNFKAEKIVSRKGFSSMSDQLSHQASWKKPVFEVYQDASLSYDWTAKLKEKCVNMDIEYFTSPYDFESVDHVDPYVNAYKIGSGDITWLEIIRHIALKRKPVMLASGASDIEDVNRAMAQLIQNTEDIVLMQCNTNYTANFENFRHINLNVLKLYSTLFPTVIIGLSDHTFGDTTVLGAIALGARVIEKHFTDDNSRTGPDHKFAMNPVTFRQMVDRSAELDLSLGDGVKRIEDNEQKTVIVQRRGLRYTRNLEAGHLLESQDFIPLRPICEGGLPPYRQGEITGKKLIVDVCSDDPVLFKNIKND